MICTCGSNRILGLYMKHDGYTNVSIPHLKVEIEGCPLCMPYVDEQIMPGLGVDDIQMKICLECGTIQGFKKLSDKDILTGLEPYWW